MKKVVAVALLLALVLFLIPLGVRQERKTQEKNTDQPDQALTLPDSGRTLTILVDGQVQEMDLNQYLWGVVAAEMPASFEEEALKAQANWGENAAAYTDKITQAVAETNNQVILYEGQLISAVFHSSSGETTQDAVAVWGNSVPYLQSVESPEGEEVPNFHSQVTFTAQEFKDTYLAAQPEAVLEGEPASWFGEITLTNGGSVGTIVIGGVTVTGVQARQIFGLRSAAFTVETTADSVTFQVTGFGHGVGMSQYGANAMAADGSTYTEILQHYYTGVTVEEYAG